MKKFPRRLARTASPLAAALLCTTTALAEKPAPWGVVAGTAATTASTSAAAAPLDAATLSALRRTIALVEQMPENERMQRRAARHGLNVLNVLWEDTARSGGSSVGPNISDVTLEVREPVRGGRGFRTHLLPVLRHPNFSDRTADIAADKLWIKVGNQSRGAQLVSVPLSEVLTHLREYVSDPDSILGGGDFSAPRDTHVLVSAQHVFVPIPEQGKIEFTPAIFNYQSYEGHPAVLTLLVTRQGTSVVAIENSGKDVIESGSAQRLYFNNKGQRTTLTAERRSDVKERIEAGQATAQDEGALDAGADMLLLVQVPLKVRAPAPFTGIDGATGDVGGSFGVGGLGLAGSGAGGGGLFGFAAPSSAKASSAAPVDGRGRSAAPTSDVEVAVLGHGDDLGPFSEGARRKLLRDPRFPVRVTVQFYKATSNGVVSDDDLKLAKAQIERVYAEGDFVGSLVVPEGARTRPTDWHKGASQPVPVLSRTTTLPLPVELADKSLSSEPEPAVSPARPEEEPASSRLASWWQRWKAWWSSADADG